MNKENVILILMKTTTIILTNLIAIVPITPTLQFPCLSSQVASENEPFATSRCNLVALETT